MFRITNSVSRWELYIDTTQMTILTDMWTGVEKIQYKFTLTKDNKHNVVEI